MSAMQYDTFSDLRVAGRKLKDISEVGDGDTDHYYWQRPADMTTSRRAYKIGKHNPGL